MGLSIFRFKKPASGSTAFSEVTDLTSDEVKDALLDFQIRELCFWSCVNIVANAVGRCEMKTYVRHEEYKGREYYLWNVEPNVNQNSTVFWHKAIGKLFEENEVLIIPTRQRNGYDAYVVADDWNTPEEWPSRQNEYQGVVVGNMQYQKTFYESDVLHLKLNHTDLTPVIRGITDSYMRLVQTAMKAYGWNSGQHWKVHVNQMASGADGWLNTFQSMLEKQIKPFLNSGSAILPEFDGYDFTNMGEKSGGAGKDASRDIRAMIDDIWDFTARAVGVDNVAVKGDVENTGDATRRTLTRAVDPICDQISEEINRKRGSFEDWQDGNYVHMDSSSIQHIDLFDQAANIEKLIGCGWSINDIRRAAGEAPINEPWADQHFVTKNFAELESLSAQEGGENE